MITDAGLRHPFDRDAESDVLAIWRPRRSLPVPDAARGLIDQRRITAFCGDRPQLEARTNLRVPPVILRYAIRSLSGDHAGERWARRAPLRQGVEHRTHQAGPARCLPSGSVEVLVGDPLSVRRPYRVRDVCGPTSRARLRGLSRRDVTTPVEARLRTRSPSSGMMICVPSGENRGRPGQPGSSTRSRRTAESVPTTTRAWRPGPDPERAV